MGYIKLNYAVCLSDTGSSCHVTVVGSLTVLVNKRADWIIWQLLLSVKWRHPFSFEIKIGPIYGMETNIMAGFKIS
jgi:hypothetical protein